MPLFGSALFTGCCPCLDACLDPCLEACLEPCLEVCLGENGGP